MVLSVNGTPMRQRGDLYHAAEGCTALELRFSPDPAGATR
eukprot:gene47076-4011_t